MAKSQKHSNREAKKPKQVKVAIAAPTDGMFAKGSLSPASKKKS